MNKKVCEVLVDDEGRFLLESIPTTLFKVTCKLQIKCENRSR
jgi:hypothetical protein